MMRIPYNNAGQGKRVVLDVDGRHAAVIAAIFTAIPNAGQLSSAQ